MEGTGRGRGEAQGVEIVDQIDERVERDRLRQMEAARLVGSAESEIPIRGRGGFRVQELKTQPANVTEVRAKNLQNTRTCDIMCNYVAIEPMQGRPVLMYRVDFEPLIESVSLARKIFRATAAQKFKKQPIFDGMHECRTGERLRDNVTSVTMQLPSSQNLHDKPQSQSSVESNQSYVVKFTYTGQAACGFELLRIYNIQMKEFLRTLGYYQPQTGLYVHPNQATQIGNELMMLRGYRTSASIHEEDRMLMNFEPGHKLVQRKSVLQLLQEIRQKVTSNEQRQANLQEVIRTELAGKLVVTAYNHRVYRIEDIDFKSRPTCTFDNKDGSKISFVEYYKTRHSITILDEKQPLLIVIPSNQRKRADCNHESIDIKLVPELCNIAGLTESQRTNNFLKMDLIKSSQVSPNDRVKHLHEFLNKFHTNQEIKSELTNWGYQFAAEPLKIKAHIMDPTKIGSGQNASRPPDAWPATNPQSADFQPSALAVAPEIKKLAILTTRIDMNAKACILEQLKRGFDKVNLRVGGLHHVDISEGDAPSHYVNQIRNLPPDTTVAVVILHAQNKVRYDAIKKAASVDRGLITQVITARLMTDQRKVSGAAVKIAIQVAAKVGGEPWWVDLPLKSAMVCGYDTYHDTEKRGRSYGAFTASMNDRYSRWFSKADAHDRPDEISSQVAANLKLALEKYKEINKKIPERVFVYRDGVSEGQLEHVYRVELSQIQSVLKEVKPTPRLTFIVVNKLIGARFYMRAQQGFTNPPPGTVIDNSVTRKNRYDFYLISQSTRHGSITPTYYNIIHDESGMRPEHHQKMAYKFCLLYYNWSGSVRVPAPCQYAHKLALLCGEHLHSQPNARLDNLLHFL